MSKEFTDNKKWRKLSAKLLRIREKLLDFFYPKFCLVCDKEGVYLCPECFSKIKTFPAPFCPYCQLRSFDGKVCKNCPPARHLESPGTWRAGRKSIWGFITAISYKEKDARKLIDTFKYSFIKELAKPLAFLIFKFLKENPEIEFFKNPLDFVILPIPLHSRRLRWRGFNQAEEIGKELVPLLKIPMKTNIIFRRRYTEPQVELGIKERKENVKEAFKVLNLEKIKNKKIILLDDVATTLSTLEETAKVLKKSGVKRVWALTVAKG